MIADLGLAHMCNSGTNLASHQASRVSDFFRPYEQPGNLLLSADGTLKIADFGLARTYGSPESRYSPQVEIPLSPALYAGQFWLHIVKDEVCRSQILAWRVRAAVISRASHCRQCLQSLLAADIFEANQIRSNQFRILRIDLFIRLPMT